MGNGNQVCILFFTGFVVYSSNEDRRPPHLMEGTDEAALESAYDVQLRRINGLLNKAKATRGQIVMEMKAGKMPGDALIDQAGKLQASVAMSAAAFQDILAQMRPAMGEQVTSRRRHESGQLLEEMRIITSQMVTEVKKVKPTISQVVNKQQFNAVHNTVHLSQDVRNRNRSPYNEASSNTLNTGGSVQPVLTCRAPSRTVL